MLPKKIYQHITIPTDDALVLTTDLIKSLEKSIFSAVKLFCPLLTPLATPEQISNAFLKHLDEVYKQNKNKDILIFGVLFEKLQNDVEYLTQFLFLINKYNVTLPLHVQFKKRFLETVKEIYNTQDEFEALLRKRIFGNLHVSK